MKKTIITTAILLSLANPAQAQGRPPDCPKLWCGCWLAKQFGFADKTLNLARAWLRFPRTEPRPGAVAVLKRGRGGHVGIVKAIDANGNPTLLSGNFNHRVGVGTYPKNRVLAYVQP